MAAKRPGARPSCCGQTVSFLAVVPSGGGPKACAAEVPESTEEADVGSETAAQHRLIIGLIVAIWRVLWGIAWRGAAIGALVYGGIVWYFYAQLPDVTDLIDGRARGSVTCWTATARSSPGGGKPSAAW